MNFYWIKTNRIIKLLFPKYIWDIPSSDQTVYLTFDDGPIPEVTEWVLNQLKTYSAKATFFCIGDNIEKHPLIFEKIIQQDHAIGNHTQHHLNGWKTGTENYLNNVKECEESIRKYCMKTSETKLFRPPYGKIKFSQSRKLRESGYQIIMWDVLSADFNQEITPEKCLKNVLQHIRPGSIIIFHDSVKAFKNLEYTLPSTLQFLKENDYTCAVIP